MANPRRISNASDGVVGADVDVDDEQWGSIEEAAGFVIPNNVRLKIAKEIFWYTLWKPVEHGHPVSAVLSELNKVSKHCEYLQKVLNKKVASSETAKPKKPKLLPSQAALSALELIGENLLEEDRGLDIWRNRVTFAKQLMAYERATQKAIQDIELKNDGTFKKGDLSRAFILSMRNLCKQCDLPIAITGYQESGAKPSQFVIFLINLDKAFLDNHSLFDEANNTTAKAARIKKAIRVAKSDIQ